MIKIVGVAAVAILPTMMCAAQTYRVKTLVSEGVEVTVTGFLAQGEVAGYYTFPNSAGNFDSAGFLYLNGKANTIQAPLAGDNGSTSLYGLNSSGYTVGDFLTSSQDSGCFVRSPEGAYTYFAEESSATLPNLLALGLNSVGEVVGRSLSSGGVTQGFKLSGGKYVFLAAPGGLLTTALGINKAEVIVGKAVNATTDAAEGFIYDEGSFTVVSYPGAYSTVLTGINDAGIAAGYYQYENSPTAFGFTYSDGTFTSVSLPQFQSFQILGITNQGALFGTFVNPTTGGGFVAVPTQPGEEPTTENVEVKFNL